MAQSLLQIKTQYPDPFRQGVVSLLWENSPLMKLLNFIKHNGFSYPYATLNQLPGISFRSLNELFADSQSVVAPATENLSVMGGRIRTDAISTIVKGPEARQNEIVRTLKAAAKFWDASFINGNPAVTKNSFLGLKARIASSSTQLITPNANGGPVTMDGTLALLDAVEGDNADKILVMNRTTRRYLSHDVGKSAGGRRVFDWQSGQQETGAQVGQRGWTTFEGAKVIETFFDNLNNPILPFTETCGSSGATCCSMYCARLGSEVDEEYLQGITGIPEVFDVAGPINFGEFLIDVIQGLFGIGVFSGYAIARYQGITNAAS